MMKRSARVKFSVLFQRGTLHQFGVAGWCRVNWKTFSFQFLALLSPLFLLSLFLFPFRMNSLVGENLAVDVNEFLFAASSNRKVQF
jgi:hypothetical protein